MKKIFAILIVIALLFSVSACASQNDQSGDKDNTKPTKVSFEKSTYSIIKGKTEQLKTTVEPNSAKDKSLKFSSSDEKVATINSDGLLTAVNEGTATITATTVNDITGTCKVTVTKLYEYWDGKYPDKKPDTLKVSGEKEKITFSSGVTKDADVVLINKIEEFAYFFGKSSFEDISSSSAVVVRLMKDFDLNDKDWTPTTLVRSQSSVKYFMIDGNDKEIRVLNAVGANAAFLNATNTTAIDVVDLSFSKCKAKSTSSNAAIVNCNDKGVVNYKNVKITNSSVVGTKIAGGIAAVASSNFDNCTLTGVGVHITPTGDNLSCGGLSGTMTLGDIKDCSLTNVIVSIDKKNLENCKAKAGALLGIAEAKVTFSGTTTLKECEINNDYLYLNSQLIFSDNRTDKNFGKIKIEFPKVEDKMIIPNDNNENGNIITTPNVDLPNLDIPNTTPNNVPRTTPNAEAPNNTPNIEMPNETPNTSPYLETPKETPNGTHHVMPPVMPPQTMPKLTPREIPSEQTPTSEAPERNTPSRKMPLM